MAAYSQKPLLIFLCTLTFIPLCTAVNCSALKPDIYYRYHYSHENASLLPASTIPDVDEQNCSSINDSQCCRCNTSQGDYFLCHGLDNALRDLHDKATNANGTNFHFLLSLFNSSTKELAITLEEPYIFTNVEEAVIQGIGEVAVNCSKGAGLQFVTSRYVAIERITWRECGLLNSTSTRYHGALVFTYCNRVTLSETNLEDSTRSGVVFALPDFTGGALWTDFFYEISYCNFYRGSSPDFGGGMTVHIDSSSYKPQFWFRHCNFVNNSASSGGGVYLRGPKSQDSCSQVFTFQNCAFIGNHAFKAGGAVHSRSTTVQFTECNFTSNTAYSAAVHVELTDLYSSCKDNVTTFVSCRWEGNKAQEASAIKVYDVRQNQDFTVVLTGSQFLSNRAGQLVYGSESKCAVLVDAVPIHISHGTKFRSGEGTALCATDTNVTIQGTVSFTGNNGYFGGAIFLSGHSIIILTPGSSLLLTNNSAAYGGGITSWAPANTTCVFAMNNYTEATPPAAAIFLNNYASIAGDSIYVNEPTNACLNFTQMSVNLTFVPDNRRAIASGFESVSLLEEEINIIPGQMISLNAEVLDFFQNPTSVQLRASFTSHNVYQLGGISFFTIQNGTTLSSLYVTGPNQASRQILNFNATTETRMDFSQRINITLNISQCPLGFQYNSATQTCHCIDIGVEYLICDINTGKACVRSGYWLGKVNGTYTVAECSSGFCEYVNLDCSECYDSRRTGFCNLPLDTQYECLGNRNDTLCASCRDNFSFTFGAVDCVPTAKCSGARIVLVPLLIVIYLFIIVSLLILFLKLDYRISSGHLFCFIYYFSIVDYFFPSNFTSKALLLIISVLESITQLNPQFLGYTPLCVPDISALYHNALLYANPIIISLIVLCFIGIAKCCSTHLRFNDNTPVRAICLLLLLSFTALNETSCSLLAFVPFNGINRIYVKIQPTLEYFANEHILWFIVAIAVELFAIIPFTVFLFLAPFLMRCFNLTRVKPFLDEFQGCYKDNFRWMAAFYFFCRQVYLLILIFQYVSSIPTIYTLQLLSLAILIIHMLLQPYKSHWLNLVDTVFLADILVITLLYGETGDTVFHSHAGDVVRMLATYILVFIPIIYFTCLIIVAICFKFPNTSAKIVTFISCRWYQANSLEEGEDTGPRTPTYTHIRPFADSISNFREPLLSYMEEEEERNIASPTHTTRNRITALHSGRERHPPTSYSVLEGPRQMASAAEKRSSSVRQTNVLTSSQSWQTENEPQNSSADDL